MNSARTGIVVVNYNSGPEIVRLSRSLKQLTCDLISLVVVDNSSPDGSGTALCQELDWAVHISADENLGFAAGVNRGIDYLLSLPAPPEYLWILNPDMEVAPDSLSVLIDAAQETGGVVGPKIIYPSDDGPRIWSAGGFIDFETLETSMRGNSNRDEGQYDARIECDYLPGCSLLFPVSLLQKTGKLPEEYFLYFEETDWCTRAKRSGVPMIYEPSALVTHFFREAKLSEPLVTYYYNRNRRVFFWRYAPPGRRISLLFKVLFLDLPGSQRSLKEAPDERYRELFKAHVESCVDFLLNRLGRRASERRKGKT